MSYHPPRRRQRGGGFSTIKIRLLIAGAIVLFSLVSYMMTSDVNPVTGEAQRVKMSVDEEIQMGIAAAPQMAAQHQGLSDDQTASSNVRVMGERLVVNLQTHLQRQGKEIPYPFEFHLLSDEGVVNAFALPGGQVFITEALYYRLTDAGQLAGILGHEIGHVIERHGAERMANAGLWQQLAGAAGVAGGDVNSARMASMVGNFVQMKYGREDELESDRWGIALMVLSGYHPDHMLDVMDILEETSGGGGQPEFMSTHPRPANRKSHIEQIVAEKFPNGLPPGLR
ncbi:MAG: M48 family metalloprotease [Planctomycetota bacterium]